MKINHRPRPPQQLIPLVILAVVMLGALVVARRLLIPESFGDIGHYRAKAIDEVAALPISYAGGHVCAECHDDIAEQKQHSAHSRLSCETCHGPAAAHVEEPDSYIPDAPRGRDYCVLCHGYNSSRPTGFPQILPNVHNPGQPCMACHGPHEPTLEHPPEDCSACHRAVASLKAVSHHTTLECTDCHRVSDEHLTDPRSNKANKPIDNAACGRCHDIGANSPRHIPRIEVATHSGRYQCWDCHYPHYPEVNR